MLTKSYDEEERGVEGLRFYSDNKHFRNKRGGEASLEHLTPASIEALKGIEDEFDYGGPQEKELVYSKNLNRLKAARKIRISKEHKDKWDDTGAYALSLSADILPYFSLCFAKVINTDNYEPIPDEVVEKFGKTEITNSPSSTSFIRRRERVNNRDDRFKGYLLVRPDKMKKYFNEDVLEAAVGRGVEVQALNWITKDDEYVESVVG